MDFFYSRQNKQSIFFSTSKIKKFLDLNRFLDNNKLV